MIYAEPVMLWPIGHINTENTRSVEGGRWARDTSQLVLPRREWLLRGKTGSDRFQTWASVQRRERSFLGRWPR